MTKRAFSNKLEFKGPVSSRVRVAQDKRIIFINVKIINLEEVTLTSFSPDIG